MDDLKMCQRAFFEKLHAWPELGDQEFETTKAIRLALETEGIEILPSPLKTGLVAKITGAKPGLTVGLRADIDALPIREETDLAYASRHEGVMHACGHDAHAAIMVYAAILLNREKENLSGSIKLFFQPAEEISLGGRAMVKTGLTDDCDAFLAVHTYPAFEAGVLGVREGPVMAATDRFGVTIQGRGSHAAHPHRGIDPIPPMAAFIQSAQTLISRGSDPFSNVLLSITHAEAGTTWNIIPETALIEGTVRTLDENDRTRMEQGLRRMARDISAAHGATASFKYTRGPSAVVNDPRLCAMAREVAADLGLACERQGGTLEGEDFSEYLAGRPGLFVRVGTGGGYPQHHPKFTVDENALWPASLFVAEMTKRLGAGSENLR